MNPNSIVTTDSAAILRSNTRRLRRYVTSVCWKSAIPRSESATTKNCGGPLKIRSWRANFYCARRCSIACVKRSRSNSPLVGGVHMIRFVDDLEMIGQGGHQGAHPRHILFCKTRRHSATICSGKSPSSPLPRDQNNIAAKSGLRQRAEIDRQALRHRVHDMGRRGDRPALSHADHREQVFGGVEGVAMWDIEPQPTQMLLDQTADFGARRVADHRQAGGHVAQRLVWRASSPFGHDQQEALMDQFMTLHSVEFDQGVRRDDDVDFTAGQIAGMLHGHAAQDRYRRRSAAFFERRP